MWLKPVLRNKTSKGFTLIELMMTVAILAVAIALAGPPLQGFIKNNRLTSEANKLVSAIMLARNEAVARREAITVEFFDADDDPTTTDADVVGWRVVTSAPATLASYALGDDLELSSVASVTFSPDGFRDMSANTVLITLGLCSEHIDGTRLINISPAGTTSVNKDTGGCESL